MAFGANFISSWIRIRIWNADPDPGDKFNADPCGSGYGSETLEKTPYHLQSSSEKRRFPHKDEDITGFGGTSTKGLESLQWFNATS